MRFWFALSFLCAGAIALADDTAQEAQFISNARPLVLEGKRSGEGYFSLDGKKLIFQSEREPGNPFYQEYILDLDSGETTRVSPGMGKTTCGFFEPGTNRVLFASTQADPKAQEKQKAELDFRASGKQRRYAWDYDESFEIFSAKLDGSDAKNLTHSLGYDAEGSYSPDGKQIVFSSLRAAFPLDKLKPDERKHYEQDASYFGDIYIMNADGSNVRRLTNEPGYDGGPFFSPDGARIVWRHFDESGVIADVWTMKLDGSDKKRVTDFKAMSWAPFYHPSGRYFIFTSNKLGFENFELFMVDAAGEHEPVRVTFTDGFDGLPTFSPDGKKLSWTTNRNGGQSQIFIADWNDAAAQAAIAAAPKRGGAPNEQFSPEISAKDLQTEVQWLADGKREGRLTGSAGAQEAAKWLGDYYHSLGLKNFGGSFSEPFEFNAGERVIAEKTKLEINGQPQKLEEDFRPLAFSENGDVSGEVVFAGYGLVAPAENYDSYAGLDVKDKIVLLLRYVPEGVDPPRRAQLNRYASLRYKTMLAREHGAKAVLVVTGPNSPKAGEVLPLTNDGTTAGSAIVAASISGKVAEALVASTGKSLKDLQTALDTENPHTSGGMVLPNESIKISVGLEHLKKTDNNVVAVLPPAQGVDEYILVGAHYDHLGARRHQLAGARGRGKSNSSRRGRQRFRHSMGDGTGGVARATSGKNSARDYFCRLVGRRNRNHRVVGVL